MKIQTRIRRLVVAGAATAALGLAAAVQAVPTLNPTGWASTPNGNEPFHIVVTSPSLNEDISAGGFIGTQTDLLFPGSSSILFWCYELDQFFGFGGSYTDYSVQAVTPPAANTALSELFTEAFLGAPLSTPMSDITSAAFQLAVWEIRYDTGGPYDLSSGDFTVTGGPGDPSTAIATAQNWLNGLSSAQARYDVTLLHSPTAQDFVTATPSPLRQVPEPSPLPLLAAGLAAMIVIMRRRRIGTHV